LSEDLLRIEISVIVGSAEVLVGQQFREGFLVEIGEK